MKVAIDPYCYHRYFGELYAGIEVDPDTANNLRTLENSVDAIAKLAPFAKAVHLKDVTSFKGSPRDFGFWPSEPVGQGLIDIPLALAELKKVDYGGLLAIDSDYLHPDFGAECRCAERGLRKRSSGDVPLIMIPQGSV